MVVETIAFLGLAYGARKLHKRHKSKRALRDAAAGVVDSQPPVYSSGPGTPSSWPKTALQVVNEVPENPSKHTHAALGTSSPAASATSSLPSYTEDGLEWRPVYLFERSTSKTQHNYIRIHRALFVGELDQSLQQGRTYEIKKQKASFLGLLSRDMTFTDAEQWLGAKQCDREPVYLGHTFWTDQQLNEEGTSMCENYHTYSLTYSNCQHFVHDLAEKIIPEHKLHPGARDATQPTFERFTDELKAGNYTGRGQGFARQVADMSIDAAKNTSKFFHLTKAALKCVSTLSWKPFDEHMKWMFDERRRHDIAAHSREQKRLAGLSPQHSGSSSSSNLPGQKYGLLR